MSLFLLSALLLSMAELPQKSGIYEETLETPDGDVLRYAISIPKGYQTGRPRPLVLALHYGGRVTPYYGKGMLEQLVEPGLKSLGAIMIAPDCPHRVWTNPESEAAVMALVELILESYTIDRSRILVTGYSLGGHGTWYMAARHPDLFSAAIPIAGSPPTGAVEQLGKMPLFVIHSRHDEVVPIEPTREAAKALEDRGAPVELFAVYGISHYEVPRFVNPLRKAAGWVKKRWKN
jgi:predicted peptidase